MQNKKSNLSLRSIRAVGVLTVLALCSIVPAKADVIALGISLDGTVRLSGTTILDQGPLDTDPTTGSVSFSQMIRGFQVTGSLLALTPDPLDPTVRLEDVTITCTSTAVGCGPLPFVFFGTFSQDAALEDGVAFDGLSGTFSNPAGLSAGANITFQGFVNGAPISTPFSFTAPTGATSASFQDEDLIPFVLPPGLVLLDGVVTVTLTGIGDRLTLDFAEVGVEPAAAVIPEPSTFVLAGLGAGLVAMTRLRSARRK